ncbi:hypothetical protein [Methanosarcina barkeri]|nr:hypothetical protein [Methanosarcina barkeri]
MSHETFYHVIAVDTDLASSTSILYVTNNKVSFDKKGNEIKKDMRITR